MESRRRRQNNEEEEIRTDDWLLTYGDLMTQLVCFFVLLLTFSSMNSIKFMEVIKSLQEALGGSGKGILTALPATIDDLPQSSTQQIEDTNLLKLKSKIDKYISNHNMSEHLETEIRKEGLVITLKQKEPSVFFDSADARIKSEAYKVLDEISKLIKGVTNNIRVEGHTDSRPINTPQFPSNWELSTMRATNVLRYLQLASDIPPEQFSAAGYGPYRPIATNATEVGMSKNRRVEIIILRSTASSDVDGNKYEIEDRTSPKSKNLTLIQG